MDILGKIIEGYWKNYFALKLSTQREALNVGAKLLVFRRNTKNVNCVKNIKYDNNKLTKFDVYTPKNNFLPATIFYIHGGAWSSCDKNMYDFYCDNLCSLGFNVVNINYRLIPEVDFETTIKDCENAIKFAIKNKKELNITLKNVFFVGDSAGAHISSLIAGKITSGNSDIPLNIRALGLYYGVYDFKNINSDESKLMRDFYKYFKTIYKENLPEFLKRISTTTYLTKNFPACFITCGKIDKLNMQTQIFMDELEKYNIETKALIFLKNRKDARHAFLNFTFTESSKEVFKKLTEFFKEKIIY